MITQCCVEALYKLGPEYQKQVNTAKTFERRRCNHREPLDPDECLKDVIGSTNKHNYVLAAQSASLRITLQKVPGLPIIHFNPRQVPVLSPPSIATTRTKNEMEEKKRKEGEMGAEVVDGDNVIGGSTTATRVSGGGAGEVRGKRKTKAPNPLSIRKKKSEPTKRTREEVEEEDIGIESSEEKEGGGEGGADAGGKRRKKRKRGRGKGAVAEARAELAGMESGSEGGSDSD